MLILRYTRYILVLLVVYLSHGMSISYLVYTELCWVYRGMGDFRVIDTQFCRTVEWFSNVWICKHTCPITRHRDLESKVKKSCADFDSRILTSYRYILVYTEYNLVYTMRIQNQGKLSYIWNPVPLVQGGTRWYVLVWASTYASGYTAIQETTNWYKAVRTDIGNS